MMKRYDRNIGNYFTTIKVFDQIFAEDNNCHKPDFEEMILQPYKIFDLTGLIKIFVGNRFSRKLFTTIKIVDQKCFEENFLSKPVFEEMILQRL